MNILWIPNFLPFPIDNGGKVVISNRMRQVSKKHSIYLVAESEDITDSVVKQEMYNICKKCILITPMKRSKMFLFKHFLTQALNVARYKNQEMTRAIVDCIQKYHIDLINIDLPMPYVNLYPIGDRLCGIPVVVNQHNIEFQNIKSKLQVKDLNLFLKMYAAIEYRKLYSWERKIYSQDCIRAFSFVSDIDLGEFKSNFECENKCLFFSPIGTNLPQTKNVKKIESLKKKIVFPASFDYGPNVHGALWFSEKVMPIIRENVNDVELYLVGKNPKQEIIRLNSSDIIVTGTVASIIPYLYSADIFIVPIFFGGGVKTKLIEMGCWKKPVISTSIGRLGTIYEDRIDIVVEDSALGFAEECIKALRNPNEFTYMEENMYKKTIDNYLWENIGIKYCDFLEEIQQDNTKS